MRPICALFCTLAFLSVAISAAKSELRDQTGSLGWQTFKVSEYGTRVEYPSEDLRADRASRKGGRSAFRERRRFGAVLSIYARENEEGDTPSSYLKKNLRQPVLDYERVVLFIGYLR
jgi:hypothetical protein